MTSTVRNLAIWTALYLAVLSAGFGFVLHSAVVGSRTIDWVLTGIWLSTCILGIAQTVATARRIYYMGRLEAMTEEHSRTAQLLKDLEPFLSRPLHRQP